MAKIIIPTWEHLHELVDAAEDDLTICSPYFSQLGIRQLFDHLTSEPALNFWTKISPSDWALGIDDPVELLTMLDILLEGDRDVFLAANQRLHAKAYLANNHFALIGSANLTGGGFANNIELMVLLRDDEAREAARFIREQVGRHLIPVEIDKFRDWVEEVSPMLSRIKVDNDETTNLIGEIQHGLDDLLGYGGHEDINLQRITHIEMRHYVEWLRSNRDLPGAKVLIQRHDNTDGNNLTGHFRQCYYAVNLFLQLNPNYINPLCNELELLNEGEIFQPAGVLLDEWMDHIDKFATLSDENFNYSILRGILPPTLGGTRTGGGGASSTLKRMFPLVAMFLDNH
jgi:hypothetical protein